MASVPNQISAIQAAREIAAGRLTSEALVRACLGRIAERDPTVLAWAFLNPDLALEQARACDRGPKRGVLHGVPVGVKDVIDTVDMPTAYNSPIYAGHRPRADAACVAAVRRAGAVILGKTETTEFANNHPARTRNPHNLSHTPGGSSSGSAAAVADYMVPFAFGTQTGGSTIRPAAFCGIVGYKPTFNTINRGGMKFVAESLDTIGTHARSVEDAALLACAASGRPMPEFSRFKGKPKVGVYRTPHWDKTDERTRMLLADVVDKLRAAGWTVVDADLPPQAVAIYDANSTIMQFEEAYSLGYEFDVHRAQLSEDLTARIERGRATSRDLYERAIDVVLEVGAMFVDAFRSVDVLLTPSAPGEAPFGLTTTGNALFNRNWTTLGLPCVTIPVGQGPKGLPLGVQFVGPYRGDSTVLLAADAAWKAISR
ncbi:MAG: amidase [Proteobacteria bacterium]|nr:amidase [Burkholderiales bacterium]